MKNTLILSFLIALGSWQVAAQSLAQIDERSQKTTVHEELLHWGKMTHDFGEIQKDVPAKAKFKLTNRSDKAMIVQEVKGSCGCTATGHSDEPILPGESTWITATYNAKKPGPFNKSVTVRTSLDKEPTVLRIKGTVQVEEN